MVQDIGDRLGFFNGDAPKVGIKAMLVNRILLSVVLLLAGGLDEAFAGVEPDPLSLWQAGDRAAAIAAWKSLAGHGDGEASLYLGYLYRNGIGVEGDDALAAKWYRQAAQAGHAEAQYELGLMYELGIGVPGDPGEAAYWYGLATTEFCPAELSAGGRLGDR